MQKNKNKNGLKKHENVIAMSQSGEYIYTRYKNISKMLGYSRNGKRNHQKLQYKCMDRSRHNQIKDAKAKCAH